MILTYSTENREINFIKPPNLELSISSGKIYLYGSIFFLYEDDGKSPIDYSEDRLVSIIEKYKEKSALYIEGNFFIFLACKNDSFFFADFFGRYRTYCTLSTGTVFISELVDDLIQINPEENIYEKEIFARKGYTCRHNTLYKKIYRIIGGQSFIPKTQCIETTQLFDPGKVGLGKGTYAEFEKIINSTFPYFFSKNKRNIIEFSGGIDSNLLALYAKINNFDFELVTGRIRNPSLDQNKYDVNRSLQKAFDLNTPINIIDVDISAPDIKNAQLITVRKMMPFEKHFGKLHVKLGMV